MNRRTFIVLTSIFTSLPGCVLPIREGGPGMSVTFTSLVDDRYMVIEDSRLPNGKAFNGVGIYMSGTRQANWRASGFTEGAAPDNRALPEWVQITWSEIPNPGVERKAFSSEEDYSRAVQEEHRSAPIRSARIPVRSRIPQDVVDEVMEAKRKRKPHDLPEKMLRIYFIWTDNGVKFRWRLTSKEGPSREGGDEIT